MERVELRCPIDENDLGLNSLRTWLKGHNCEIEEEDVGVDDDVHVIFARVPEELYPELKKWTQENYYFCVRHVVHLGVYQTNKAVIEKIKALMERHMLIYVYRTYNKRTITFWHVDSDFIELTAFARSLLDMNGVHEVKVLHRLRNISTPKEAYWGGDILRLTVEFYEY